MPAYDYRCQSCQKVFEKTQRISEPAGATCPECGNPWALFVPCASAWECHGADCGFTWDAREI